MEEVKRAKKLDRADRDPLILLSQEVKPLDKASFCKYFKLLIKYTGSSRKAY